MTASEDASAKVPTDEPKSARWPWLRSLGYSLMTLLSPAVWVIDTSSCEGASAEATPLTGVQLVQGMDVSGVPDILLVIAMIAVTLGAPWLAWRARKPLARLGWHTLGLLGAVAGMLATGLVVYFTIFHVREVQAAGYLVLALGGAPVIESVVRIGLGIGELRAHRARAGPSVAGEGVVR